MELQESQERFALEALLGSHGQDAMDIFNGAKPEEETIRSRKKQADSYVKVFGLLLESLGEQSRARIKAHDVGREKQLMLTGCPIALIKLVRDSHVESGSTLVARKLNQLTGLTSLTRAGEDLSAYGVKFTKRVEEFLGAFGEEVTVKAILPYLYLNSVQVDCSSSNILDEKNFGSVAKIQSEVMLLDLLNKSSPGLKSNETAVMSIKPNRKRSNTAAKETDKGFQGGCPHPDLPGGKCGFCGTPERIAYVLKRGWVDTPDHKGTDCKWYMRTLEQFGGGKVKKSKTTSPRYPNAMSLIQIEDGVTGTITECTIDPEYDFPLAGNEITIDSLATQTERFVKRFGSLNPSNKYDNQSREFSMGMEWIADSGATICVFTISMLPFVSKVVELDRPIRFVNVGGAGTSMEACFVPGLDVWGLFLPKESKNILAVGFLNNQKNCLEQLAMMGWITR